MSHGVVPDRLAEGARAGIGPLARALAAMGISANAVTIAGGVLSVIGAGFLAAGMPLPALIVLLIGTLADTLDGQLAKASGGGTRLGAFLDSTVDRVADGALFVGAAVAGANLGQMLLLWSSLIALVASFLVPYVRAKAESLGVSASVGPAPREARIVIFLIGLASWAVFDLVVLFVAAVLALALLSTITFVLRVVHVGRQLSTKER
ncbi:MAG: CDP-alcohol phosphatidyltransferase family protein [Chloroflexi bacterium]|nr:MAG: CDP-alcohol phosphatidyltransferase family protein [Chloroflexota bacterium]TMG63088.1 MAG: CDP-alcohol phosphatidyltransferase family protein [Chloroflexota bacterium]